MNIKKQFSIMKLESKYLKSKKNDVVLTYSQAKANGMIVGLSDGEMLRIIRRITGKEVDMNRVADLYKERQFIKKQSDSKENSKKIHAIQKEIDNSMFMPEYVTVKMVNEKQYEKIHKDGFYITLDGVRRHYRRLACSASQGRVSTVTFCDSSILDKVMEICENGRDVNVPLVPAKYNAYFGLYLSSSEVVSKPRFCVVPDFENEREVRVNYVTETEGGEDDLVELRDMVLKFNRTDGMGLISPKFAKIWSQDLNVTYTPAQFCIRQSWTKGMLTVFDFHDFCEKKNGGNYEATDVWGNKVNLRDIDVILTESQFKLWSSYPNQKYYEECCEKNGLNWGVSIYTPEKDKDILNLNYQFLQTLDLTTDEHIEEVCKMFEEWVKSASYDNIMTTLLFLLGVNHDEVSIQNYLRSSENYWVKALMVNHELINDKYIRQKIYNILKGRLNSGCLGRLIANGNFQVIVSDPYGFMQHVCGLEVTGLLKDGEFYSNYWNEKGINKVDGMRSPLTYRNEHVVMDLVKTEETEYWYKHMYTGVILNYYGYETMNFGGSDFDM